jgi:hypothetical protein
VAGIATRGGALDRIDRPRCRPQRLHRRLLGQQARPDLEARAEARCARRSRPRRARGTGGARHADPADGRAARCELHDRAPLAEALRAHDTSHSSPGLDSGRASDWSRGRSGRLPCARPESPRPPQGRRSSLSRVQECGGERTPAPRQGTACRGGGRLLQTLRLLGEHRGVAVSPRRSGYEVVRGCRWRHHALAREVARRGCEVRPALRNVPCGGRAGCQAATLSADDPWRPRAVTAESSDLRG